MNLWDSLCNLACVICTCDVQLQERSPLIRVYIRMT